MLFLSVLVLNYLFKLKQNAKALEVYPYNLITGCYFKLKPQNHGFAFTFNKRRKRLKTMPIMRKRNIGLRKNTSKNKFNLQNSELTISQQNGFSQRKHPLFLLYLNFLCIRAFNTYCFGDLLPS